jgi:phospholipid/cholesterol/gamma-HCH transport system substrate-binding protein
MRNSLETRLGLFFALVAVAAVILIETVGGLDLFQPRFMIRARFQDAHELKQGDPVRMAGVQIGRVESIAISDGAVEVAMRLSRPKEVRTGSRAAIKFTGLMGQNYVAVEFGPTSAPPVEENTVLETSEQVDLSTIMVKLDNVATGIENITKSFTGDSINNLLGPFTDFLKENSPRLSAILENSRVISGEVAQGNGTVGKLIREDTFYTAALQSVTNLNRTADDIRSAVAQARTVVDQISQGQGTLGKLTMDETLYRESTLAMSNLREIFEKINQGKGSVGKLVNDESLFRNAKMTLQKVEKATEGLEDQGPLSVLSTAVNSLF